MSDVATWRTVSDSSENTEKLGEQLGRQLRGGEVIELIGDLGAGKTTFVRGLARGVGSTDIVASPTFTISKVYVAGKLQLHHFDLYRLSEPGIIIDELAEIAGDPSTITLIEWGDSARHILPDMRLTITISQDVAGNRVLEWQYPESLTYLIEK